MFSPTTRMILLLGLAFVFSACSDDDKSGDEGEPSGLEDVVVSDGAGDAGAHVPDTFLDTPSDFGLPCESNNDCSSGFCVQSPEGFICTIPCLEECPDGYSCKAIANLNPDIVFICFPESHVDECNILPDGSACDDGNACTEEDYCGEGFCQGGISLDCEDGNPCTTHSCNFKSGCEYTPTDGDCDDLNTCTMEDHCEEGVCMAGEALDCTSDEICMDGFCDPELGCVLLEKDCDDGIDFTVDICLEDGCNNIDGCGDLVVDNILCEMAGNAGDIVSCPFRIARAEANIVNAHGLQFTFSFEESLASLTHFTSCPDCLDNLPPLTSLPTGHFVGMAPPNIADWEGSGQLILANLVSTSPLTTAFVIDGQVEGDATFLTAHFVLKADVPENQPLQVKLGKIFVSDALAAPLYAKVVDKTLITQVYEISCENNGKACDDGNVCTVEDRCITKVCVGEDIPCNDEDPCTFDYCDVATGCYHASAADGCVCDDGDACTMDSICQSGSCVGTPIPTCDSSE